MLDEILRSFACGLGIGCALVVAFHAFIKWWSI